MANPVPINSLRDEYESEAEWNLRRRFLQANVHDLSLDRLVCLSRCFINIVIYSCSYPQPVMQEVHQRGKYLLEDQTHTTNPGTNCKTTSAQPAKRHQPLFRPRFKGISFVQASDSQLSSLPVSDGPSEMEECAANNKTALAEGNSPQSLGSDRTFLVGCKNEKSPTSAHDSMTGVSKREFQNVSDNHATIHSNESSLTEHGDSNSYKSVGMSIQSSVACPKGHEDIISPNPAGNSHVLEKIKQLASLFANSANLKGRPQRIPLRSAADIFLTYAEKVPLKVDTEVSQISEVGDCAPSVCELYLDGVSIVVARGSKSVIARRRACKTAVQKILLPHLKIVSEGSSFKRVLQASAVPFSLDTSEIEDEKKPMIPQDPIHPSTGTQPHLPGLEKDYRPSVNSQLFKLAQALITITGLDPISQFTAAGQKARVSVSFEMQRQMKIGSDLFSCTVYVDRNSIATGQGQSMKIAKRKAYEAAVDEVVKCSETGKKYAGKTNHPSTYHIPQSSIINPVSHGIGLQTQPSQNTAHEAEALATQHNDFQGHHENVGVKRCHSQSDLSLSEQFVIVEPDNNSQILPRQTVDRSASLSRKVLSCIISETVRGFRCVLLLDSEIQLADAMGLTELDAKTNAFCKALEMLRRICWTIKIKGIDSDKAVSKDKLLTSCDQLIPDAVSENMAISSDNVGSKMLQKMGWSGGGLGKDSTGIVEPVSLQRVFKRQGLGLSAENGGQGREIFENKVKSLLRDFALSDSQEELVFASDLGRHEREFIHMECRKYSNITSRSHGKGDNRNLVISQKRSIHELLRHLQSVGGETDRYRLVPPGSGIPSVSL